MTQSDPKGRTLRKLSKLYGNTQKELEPMMRGARASFLSAVLPAALISLMIFTPASAAEMTVAEAGARYGQAQSAAKFCPGGKVTTKALELEKSYSGEAAAAFKLESEKVTAAWDKAFTCIEIDVSTNRTTECRKMRLTSCRQAWVEIGAEGRAAPGLLDVDFAAFEAEHRAKD